MVLGVLAALGAEDWRVGPATIGGGVLPVVASDAGITPVFASLDAQSLCALVESAKIVEPKDLLAAEAFPDVDLPVLQSLRC